MDTTGMETTTYSQTTLPTESTTFTTPADASTTLLQTVDVTNVTSFDATTNGCTIGYDEWDNIEYTWVALSMIPLMIFGITGNTLVIIAVTVERRLQSVTNYFLLSLALTDLLVSLIVMPFSIIHSFIGFWPLGLTVCNLFVTSDVLMCTCSIFHMCTISLERFLAIRFPLKVRNKSKTVVMLKIVIVWVSSFVISSPITILGHTQPQYLLKNHKCAFDSDDFVIYGSIFAFFIPLVIMVIAYALTVYMLHKQAGNCRDGAKDGSIPLIRRSRSTRTRGMKKPRVMKSLSYPLRRRSQESSHTSSSTANTPVKVVNRNGRRHWPRSATDVSSQNSNSECEASDTALLQVNGDAKGTPASPGAPKLKMLLMKHNIAIKAANLLLTKRDLVEKQNAVRNEQKASKVLGIVFLLFVILWAPFFTVNIMTALCKKCFFEPVLITIFVWLGYASSTFNPIIYTIFNSTFKNTFIKLLRCNYHGLEWPRRSIRRKFTSTSSPGYHNTPAYHAQAFRDKILLARGHQENGGDNESMV